MSLYTLTDNLGNSYQLTSDDRITSLAASDYFTAIDALERIDYLQLAAAEDELFQWTDWHPEFGLTVNSGPGWQSTESTNLFQTQAHHPHIGSRFLPDRWPQILDAIHRGNLRFVQVDAAKTSKNENPQDTRSILRVKIRQALLTIVAAEKAEAAHHARRLQQETSVNRGLIYTGAFLTGLWQAGAGFAQWLKEVNDVLNPLQRSLRGVRATQRALQRNESGESLLAAYRDEMLIAEKREIVQALGFDPTAITRQQFQHAIELADLIWEDPSLQADLRRFVKDYVSAQHTIEITEFSGAAAFEVLFTILLAAVTGGTGLAASAANLTRYFARFRKVGELLVEFGEQVKKSRLLRDRNAPAKQSPGFEDFESIGEMDVSVPVKITPEAQRIKSKTNSSLSSKREIELAKNPGKTPEQIRARDKVARYYMEKNEFTESQISDALGNIDGTIVGGIDLNKPLEVVNYPPPEYMYQYVKSHGYPGNWFDPIGSQTPDMLGISGDGRALKAFKMPKGDGLTSFSKPILDKWTTPDSPVQTNGGGIQLLINDTTKASVNSLNGLI
ncbi:hypothetical protein [Microbulbifer pacificus]|uniref:hypothetical protein n=1 Tax=Microbulbifer pacificus TaxID=407164 RepID=UPI00131A11F7|nr:hypothetical protein [Microbulbifer pacificus]